MDLALRDVLSPESCEQALVFYSQHISPRTPFFINHHSLKNSISFRRKNVALNKNHTIR